VTPPGRLPPPKPIGVPPPPPGARTPPAYDVETEEGFGDDGPTVVSQPRCSTCPGEYITLDDDIQPPASYAEAFHDKRLGATCRGTSWWAWCKAIQKHEGPGRLLVPGRGLIAIFLDRRIRVEPVEVDRRRR